MKSGFQYRGYQISKQGDRFLATDLDDQECILESRYVIRLMNGVDALWSALETGEMHTWFTNWMGSPTPTIDLDEPDAAEHLSYDRTPTTPEFTPVIRAAAFALEAAPSEVDPPNKISFLFCCSTVAAVIPVALLIEYFNIDPVIVFRMVVVFAAVVFGVIPAIVVTALSMFAYNFSAVPPVFD